MADVFGDGGILRVDERSRIRAFFDFQRMSDERVHEKGRDPVWY